MIQIITTCFAVTIAFCVTNGSNMWLGFATYFAVIGIGIACQYLRGDL